VTKCFYAYENALVAAATALGTVWTKKHYEKSALAKRLFEQNKLKTDINRYLLYIKRLLVFLDKPLYRELVRTRQQRLLAKRDRSASLATTGSARLRVKGSWQRFERT
jgi:hypothetical protein